MKRYISLPGAEHFQAIGEQYRELYEHMAGGADTLIDPQAMDEKLSSIPAAAIESSAWARR